MRITRDAVTAEEYRNFSKCGWKYNAYYAAYSAATADCPGIAQHVVVVGAGFGGLADQVAHRRQARRPVHLTLIEHTAVAIEHLRTSWRCPNRQSRVHLFGADATEASTWQQVQREVGLAPTLIVSELLGSAGDNEGHPEILAAVAACISKVWPDAAPPQYMPRSLHLRGKVQYVPEAIARRYGLHLVHAPAVHVVRLPVATELWDQCLNITTFEDLHCDSAPAWQSGEQVPAVRTFPVQDKPCIGQPADDAYPVLWLGFYALLYSNLQRGVQVGFASQDAFDMYNAQEWCPAIVVGPQGGVASQYVRHRYQLHHSHTPASASEPEAELLCRHLDGKPLALPGTPSVPSVAQQAEHGEHQPGTSADDPGAQSTQHGVAEASAVHERTAEPSTTASGSTP